MLTLFTTPEQGDHLPGKGGTVGYGLRRGDPHGNGTRHPVGDPAAPPPGFCGKMDDRGLIFLQIEQDAALAFETVRMQLTMLCGRDRDRKMELGVALRDTPVKPILA